MTYYWTWNVTETIVVISSSPFMVQELYRNMNKDIIDHTLVQLTFTLIKNTFNRFVLYFLFGRKHPDTMYITFAYVIRPCLYMWIVMKLLCIIWLFFIGCLMHGENSPASWISWQRNDGKYKCDICGASYRHRQSWSSHKQTHQGRTSCTLCGKMFSRMALLNSHLLQMHGLQATKPRGPRRGHRPELSLKWSLWEI